MSEREMAYRLIDQLPPAKLGYVIGETLILTFETEKQPISTAVIEDLVKHYFF